MLQPTGLTSPINSPLDHAAGLHGSAEVVLEDVEAVRGRNLYLRPTLDESLLLFVVVCRCQVVVCVVFQSCSSDELFQDTFFTLETNALCLL